jgi:hypothetical protein
VSNIPFSGFILFQKHVFSQSLVIALRNWLFYIIFLFQILCCYFPSIRDLLVDPFFSNSTSYIFVNVAHKLVFNPLVLNYTFKKINEKQSMQFFYCNYFINGPMCLIPLDTIIHNYWIFVNAGCSLVHQTVNVMIHAPTNHYSTDL